MKKKILSLITIFTLISLCFNGITIFATGENTNITFTDNNLYHGLVSYLSGNYTFENNDSTKTISISETELNKIKRIQLDGHNIEDVSGLEKFTELKELVLNNNRIGDISNLFTLNKLEYLDLAHNCVTDITGINNLSILKHLDLYDNIVRNYQSLNNMTTLEHLDLGDNNEVRTGTLTNVSAIGSLTNLKYFNFSRNNTSEIINYVTNMTKLEELNLQKNNIESISNLSGLTRLKKLYINSNSISDISSLSNLTNLEVLYLNSNNISSLSSLFNGSNLRASNMRILHAYSLKNLSKTADEVTILKNMSKAKQIEFGYEIIYDSVETHTDSNGKTYVTYDDFGARCDGEYDDMISIRDAHRYATSKGYEVKATAGKTYHIFNYYEGTVAINVNTDWQNATFIIHDENIETMSGRGEQLFTITTNYSGITTLENPNITLNTSTTKITGIDDTLATLNNKGYHKYLLVAENANKKISLRHGTTSKDNEIDCFEIDSEGNLLNDIQWDFETVTKLTIYPISDNAITIKNGNFITNSFNGIHDVPYGRGYDKPLYYYRGFFFWAASHINIENVNHTLSEDRLSGSYYNFFLFRFCADITVKDCSLYARLFGDKSRSTYDLKTEQSVNFYFENVTSNGLHDSQRWGFMASQYCKDFVFENCSVNRIDAHQVIYNLTVRNSYLGYRGFTLTGQGTLIIENTTVEAEYFINLRSDYGSMWKGDIHIRNCTHKHQSQYMFKFINFSIGLDDGVLHEFGYETKQPNIYIENFTVDCINKRDIQSYPIIANFVDHNYKLAKDGYWSDEIYINGYKIINSDKQSPYISLFYEDYEKFNKNYVITDTTVKTKSKDYTDYFNRGESFTANDEVTFTIKKQNSSINYISEYLDGNLIIDSEEITETSDFVCATNGHYKIVIDSVSTKFSKTGSKEFEFDVNIDDSNNSSETTYSILEGANQTITKSNYTNGLRIKTNGELDKLLRVEINNTTLSSTNYTVESGSTIITLKPSYLESLNPGTYTLKAVYTDGEVLTTFIIGESLKSSESSESSENNNSNTNNNNDNDNNNNESTNNNNNNSNNSSNSSNNSNNSSNSSSITVKDSTTSSGTLPQTGDKTINIIFVIIDVLILGIIARIKYKENCDFK